ncbi:dTDP-4-dehydrorhamnose 3,5-epimerase [Variovorax boronicumulans]|uniref:dTDP-4-dehydrorhamnose 3,5-epimerase family protein n=1 Tax=Variovorax boronicumulans TaxID=436515 RepID=UPI0027897414|nr:dTDP-4-dehydrorhamnose 3,5-epimerase family protein [Variovorax boronicumulans]MDQ0016168.1 dTDP-4-dehydrorhamnose 3,5-epimerase [Variovorax boronicumulans]
MARFGIDTTPLAGLVCVQRQKLEDARGFFSRFFCAEELAAAGFAGPVAQINHTLTQRRGSVRGLHFQHPPHAEDKLVSCLHGEIFDVAIDLRQGSPTFLHWHGEVLSAGNARSLLIPKGFAHGFQALSDDAELLYLHSTPYAAAAEGALNARDPALAIAWPLAFADVSERDAGHPFLSSDFTGLAA